MRCQEYGRRKKPPTKVSHKMGKQRIAYDSNTEMMEPKSHYNYTDSVGIRDGDCNKDVDDRLAKEDWPRGVFAVIVVGLVGESVDVENLAECNPSSRLASSATRPLSVVS